MAVFLLLCSVAVFALAVLGKSDAVFAASVVLFVGGAVVEKLVDLKKAIQAQDTTAQLNALLANMSQRNQGGPPPIRKGE